MKNREVLSEKAGNRYRNLKYVSEKKKQKEDIKEKDIT